MSYACRDRALGDCSGRAYKRKGWTTALCRAHWRIFLGVLTWARDREPYRVERGDVT